MRCGRRRQDSASIPKLTHLNLIPRKRIKSSSSSSSSTTTMRSKGKGSFGIIKKNDINPGYVTHNYEDTGWQIQILKLKSLGKGTFQKLPTGKLHTPKAQPQLFPNDHSWSWSFSISNTIPQKNMKKYSEIPISIQRISKVRHFGIGKSTTPALHSHSFPSLYEFHLISSPGEATAWAPSYFTSGNSSHFPSSVRDSKLWFLKSVGSKGEREKSQGKWMQEINQGKEPFSGAIWI